MARQFSRDPGLASGAKGKVSGTISNGATWSETLEITQNGTFISGATGWTWRFTFRKSYDDTPELTLTTADGTLTAANDSDSTNIAILVPPTSLSGMEGAYLADLASKDGSGVVTHWAHGTVTFVHEPVWS
jgi:hypothetical protein